uniref:Uncharacterized protein LOC111108046 isoform X2 n=1 Tax=Crassostrea virginica TaxID=6565 RepID=A0A8B8B757_CRAVI|nr:uncharacterized protein LOC111108046 isoform X2 [Crassostrea virginica]
MHVTGKGRKIERKIRVLCIHFFVCFRMRFCFVVLWIVHTAYALTSIQVQNSTIQLGKTDVDIRCLVNEREDERIRVIQLIRSNANIVSVTVTGVLFQDKELQKRAVAEGSVMNTTSSFLHMTIDRQNVTKNDGGTYFCKSFAANRDPEEKTKRYDTNDACGYKPSKHSLLLVLVAMLINYKGM